MKWPCEPESFSAKDRDAPRLRDLPPERLPQGVTLNILLTGAAGQLGSELLPLLSARGSVTATDRSTPASASGNWLELDISNGG